MKNRTKLWIFMVISAMSSGILVIILSIVFGGLWNKGYNINKLNAISDKTISVLERQSSFDKEAIKPILDSVHRDKFGCAWNGSMWMEQRSTILPARCSTTASNN